MAGLRLDRRSSVFKSGLRRVVPGSTENSFLYHRIAGSEYGLQMPPTGPLRKEQIAVIKAWIEEGAVWPDALANEADLPPPNSKAVAMVEALRAGGRQAFLKAVSEDARLLNARGPEGSTPFMYAVLYGDAPFLEELLKKGADAAARNDVGATALMWAAITDLDKVRVLVARGADVNAKSDDSRTALMIAAGRPGNTAMVKFLLEHGANPNPTANPMAQSSPLIQAALAGDAESLQMLIARGADVRASAPMALTMAITSYCAKCTELMVAQNLDKDAYTFALLNVVGYVDAKTNAMLLEHGADVNAVDPFGRTALHYAAVSDLIPADTVKLLIDHGANINAVSGHQRSGDSGLSVLDIARMNGDTAVVEALRKAGAKSTVQPTAAPKPQGARSVREAVQRSLPVLQRADAGFTAKSGCISCHNESLVASAMGLARANGYRLDEQMARQQVKVNAAYIEHERDALHQGFFAAQAGGEAFGDIFGPSVLGYVLVGLEAEHYKADLNTDAVVMYLKSRQAPDGEWRYPAADTRQPICLDYMGQTALVMRAMQLYAPKADQAAYERAVQLAASWLAGTKPKTSEDRLWQLQGLAWAGRKEQAAGLMREVVALQRPDGGWAQMATLASDPYATGRALVALHIAGMTVSDPVYQRGVEFLLKNQMEDGSWYVATRALALQPFFDSGFPHGVNQAISSAGSAWATMALTFVSGGATAPAGTAVGAPE